MNNQRNSWIAGIIIVIILIAIVVIWRLNSGTSTTTGVNPDGSPSVTDSTMMLPYGPVTLALGQEATFQGITIRPLSVAEDSRCSVGVQCIQAGTVRVLVESDLANGATRQDTLTLGTSTSVDLFTISLTNVDPAREANSTISKADYRFTFDVHQDASGVGLQGKG